METGIKVPKPKLLFEGAVEWVRSDPITFLETPLIALNDIIVGLPSSELIIVAAKPSQGKTALAMQIAASVAEGGQAVGVFSMEMSRKQLGERLACSALGIDSNRLRKRYKEPLAKDEQEQIEGFYSDMANLPLIVDDRGGLSAEKIYAASIDWKKHYDVKAIFLDYVQLIEGGDDNRQEAIGSAARIFKQIAKELEIPFVALSQLNRAMDSRESRVPRLSDLRDSGQLEQVADTVLMFSYPNSPDDDLDNIREAEIHVKKQRNGPTGIAHVQFNKRHTIFEPLNPDDIAKQADGRGRSQPKQGKETPMARQTKWKEGNQTPAEQEPS